MVIPEHGRIPDRDRTVQRIIGPPEKPSELFIGLHKLEAVFPNPELGDKTGNIVVGDALFKQGLLQLADIRHHGVGNAVAVDHFVREDIRQLDPHHSAAFMAHPAYKLIAGSAAGERFGHFIDEDLPVLRIRRIKFVGAVFKQAFVFFLGIADQFIVVLIGPDEREMLINQMLAHAQAREIHQHVVFTALADGIINEDLGLVFHGSPALIKLSLKVDRELMHEK